MEGANVGRAVGIVVGMNVGRDVGIGVSCPTRNAFVVNGKSDKSYTLSVTVTADWMRMAFSSTKSVKRPPVLPLLKVCPKPAYPVESIGVEATLSLTGAFPMLGRIKKSMVGSHCINEELDGNINRPHCPGFAPVAVIQLLETASLNCNIIAYLRLGASMTGVFRLICCEGVNNAPRSPCCAIYTDVSVYIKCVAKHT